MTFVMAWLVAPLVWSALSLGLGLGIRRISNGRLPGTLAIPVGFAVLVVLGTLTVTWKPTAILTLPLAGVLAGLGFYLGRADLRQWKAAVIPGVAAAVTYLLYALPVLLSGAPFAGWIKLDDGSTWLAFSDRLAVTGRTVAGLAPSSYEAVLQINWDSANAGGAYPIGVFPPLGSTSLLLGMDSAWLLQPYLAFLAGVLALALYVMLRPLVYQPKLTAGLTVLAATPALLLGYSLWGGIKEMGLAPLLVIVPLLAMSRFSSVALAAATAAVLAIAGFSGGAWVALPLLAWLVVTLTRRAWPSLLIMVAATLVMSLPLLIRLELSDITSLFSFATASKDIGNLAGPLNRLQVLGIWPVGDFRETPVSLAPVYLLLAVVVLLAVLGLWWAVRNRWWALPVYAANVLLIAVLFSFGNAWIGGKALAMASPAALLAAAAGVGWLWGQRRQVEAWTAVALLGVGVVWSYALAYQQVWLAPTAQLQELRAIGQDRSQLSPALMLEYSPYGVRHFLRDLDPEGAGELRRRSIPTVNGGTVAKAAYADIDEISQQGLADFPTLVLRNSAIASRPPSDFQVVRAGQFYDVWQRDPNARQVVSHTPFGTSTDPAASPKCAVVKEVAATASPGDSLAFVQRSPLITLPLGTEGSMVPEGDVRVARRFAVSDAGTYRVDLGGSFVGDVTISVDGQEIWSGRHQLNWTGNTTPAGDVELAPGGHELTLDYSRNPLRPGSRAQAWPLGPVYLSLNGPDTPVEFVDPAQAVTLCGKRLDWLEVVR